MALSTPDSCDPTIISTELISFMEESDYTGPMLSLWTAKFNAPGCSNLAATIKLMPGIDTVSIATVTINQTEVEQIGPEEYMVHHMFSSPNLYGYYAISVEIFDATN